MKFGRFPLTFLGVIALLGLAGCAFMDSVFNLGLRDSHEQAIANGLGSPNEQIQAEAVARQREVSEIYD